MENEINAFIVIIHKMMRGLHPNLLGSHFDGTRMHTHKRAGLGAKPFF
jgi:hypothetical protein